jgi:hypothetical protein
LADNTISLRAMSTNATTGSVVEAYLFEDLIKSCLYPDLLF